MTFVAFNGYCKRADKVRRWMAGIGPSDTERMIESLRDRMAESPNA